MDPLTIIALLDAAAKATAAGVALYQKSKATLTSDDQAKVDAALAEITAQADSLTALTEARLDEAAKD